MKSQILKFLSIFILVITLVACQKEDDAFIEESQGIANIEIEDEKQNASSSSEFVNYNPADAYKICFNEYNYRVHQILRPTIIPGFRCRNYSTSGIFNGYLVVDKDKIRR